MIGFSLCFGFRFGFTASLVFLARYGSNRFVVMAVDIDCHTKFSVEVGGSLWSEEAPERL